MKTRVIHTKIWSDVYVSELNRFEKLAFLYLLTNEHINMCGIYELNDKEMIMWTGLTQDELEKVKQKFTNDRKFNFCKGWVKVINHEKYNNYGNGEKQKPAMEKELALVPIEIIDTFNRFNTSLDTSIDTESILDLNQNTENRNKKQGESAERGRVTDDFLGSLSQQFPGLDVRREWQKAQDWLLASGKRYKDHRAFLRNWLRRAEDNKPQKTERRSIRVV